MQLELQRGRLIAGRYRLERKLGEGGIGVVWEAWQTGVERRVAVKFLKINVDADFVRRFEIEARAMGRLNHPNCVTVYDFGQTESGLAYLVMEYLDGEPATMWRGRQLSIRDIVDISGQVATALAYAHHQGVVHRDLKLENIFAVEAFNGGRLIKVLDFGMAKLSNRVPEDITKTGQVFGTPAYMSPEQLRGAKFAGPPTDLYALGVIMYELIENRLPFWESNAIQLGMAHITKPVPPMTRPGLSRQLENIVRTLLAKEPHERYPDALALYDALEGVDAPHSQGTLNLVAQEPPRTTISRLPDDFVITEPSKDEPPPAIVEARPHTPMYGEPAAPGPLEIDERALRAPAPIAATDEGSDRTVYFVAAALFLFIVVGAIAVGGDEPEDVSPAVPDVTAGQIGQDLEPVERNEEPGEEMDFSGEESGTSTTAAAAAPVVREEPTPPKNVKRTERPRPRRVKRERPVRKRSIEKKQEGDAKSLSIGGEIPSPTEPSVPFAEPE